MTSKSGLYATLKAVYSQSSPVPNNMTTARDFKLSESLENLDHGVRTEHSLLSLLEIAANQPMSSIAKGSNQTW